MVRDPRAMCALYEMYREGIEPISRNIPTAMHYLREAAKIANTRALVWLGAVKCLGLFKEFGEEADPQLGVILFTKAAGNLSIDATNFLAQCYRVGMGIQKSATMHRVLSQKACDLEAENQPCLALRRHRVSEIWGDSVARVKHRRRGRPPKYGRSLLGEDYRRQPQGASIQQLQRQQRWNRFLFAAPSHYQGRLKKLSVRNQGKKYKQPPPGPVEEKRTKTYQPKKKSCRK
eukprot:jgi/Bigna1/139642/aug1.51_g14350